MYSFNDAANSSQSTALNDELIHAPWLENDAEGSDRDLIVDIFLEIFWRNWKKSRKISVEIDGLWTKILTRDLKNNKENSYPIDA
jgi:hypothetical protein